MIDSFRDGVWWVELAGLTDPALVPQTVAKAVGVQESAQQSALESLTDFLRTKQLLAAPNPPTQSRAQTDSQNARLQAMGGTVP